MREKKLEWYLRKPDGSEYGPITMSDLRRWAVQCRVVAGNGLSSDREEWIRVEDLPELEMDWIAQLDNGREYGPFNIAATRELLEHNVFTPETILTHKTTRKSVTVEQVLNEEDLFDEGSEEEGAKREEDGALSEAARREEEELLAQEAIEASEDVAGGDSPDEAADAEQAESVEAPAEARGVDAAEISVLREQVKSVEDKLSQSESELDKVRQDLAGTLSTSAEKISQLESELNEALAVQGQLENELAAERSKFADYADQRDQEAADIRSQLAAAEAGRSGLEDKLAGFEIEHKRQAHIMEKSLADLRRQSEFMSKNIAELQQELDLARRVARQRGKILVVVACIGGLALCLWMLLATRSCMDARSGSVAGAGVVLPGENVSESEDSSAGAAADSAAGSEAQVDRGHNSVPAGDAPWPGIKIDGVKAKNVGDSCVITFDEGVFASFVSLSDVAVKQLTKLADVLRPGIGKYKIEVEGHTDDRPLRNTSVYNGNDALALARGQAVEKFLTGVGKLPESAVSVLHAGTHAAPYPNNSAVNRRRNRTVVIRLVRP